MNERRWRRDSFCLSITPSLLPLILPSLLLYFSSPAHATPNLLPDRTQPVISVQAGLAAAPIDGGEGDVERLARGGEVYFESPVAIRQFKRLLQKLPRRFADGRGLIVREKAVAVEFDENPLRSPVNADAGAAPSAQALWREGITGCQSAVVNSRRRQSAPSPAPIEYQRTGQ